MLLVSYVLVIPSGASEEEAGTGRAESIGFLCTTHVMLGPSRNYLWTYSKGIRYLIAKRLSQPVLPKEIGKP